MTAENIVSGILWTSVVVATGMSLGLLALALDKKREDVLSRLVLWLVVVPSAIYLPVALFIAFAFQVDLSATGAPE